MPILSQFDNLRNRSINITDLVAPPVKEETIGNPLNELLTPQDWQNLVEHLGKVKNMPHVALLMHMSLIAQATEYTVPHSAHALEEMETILSFYTGTPTSDTGVSMNKGIYTMASFRQIFGGETVNTTDAEDRRSMLEQATLYIMNQLDSGPGRFDTETLKAMAWINVAFPKEDGSLWFEPSAVQIASFKQPEFPSTYLDSSIQFANLKILKPNEVRPTRDGLMAAEKQLAIFRRDGNWLMFTELAAQIAILSADDIVRTTNGLKMYYNDSNPKQEAVSAPPPRRNF